MVNSGHRMKYRKMPMHSNFNECLITLSSKLKIWTNKILTYYHSQAF